MQFAHVRRHIFAWRGHIIKSTKFAEISLGMEVFLVKYVIFKFDVYCITKIRLYNFDSLWENWVLQGYTLLFSYFAKKN